MIGIMLHLSGAIDCSEWWTRVISALLYLHGQSSHPRDIGGLMAKLLLSNFM